MNRKKLPLAIAIALALGLGACAHQSHEDINARQPIELRVKTPKPTDNLESGDAPAQANTTAETKTERAPANTGAAAQAAPKAMPVGPKPRLQDDFYTYVNYDYLTTTKLSADKPEINNMTRLNDQSKDTIKGIFKDLKANYASLPAGSVQKQVADFHAMAIDFEARDKLGFAPIQPYLDRIRQARSIAELNEAMRAYFLLNYTPMVSLGVAQDFKNSDMNILYITQPEIGLNKRYLLGKDEYSAKIRAAYTTFIEDLFALSGHERTEAARKAKSVVQLETTLASTMLTDEEELDRSKTYHPMSLAQVAKLTNNLPHLAILKDTGLIKAKKIVVTQPLAVKKANAMMTAKHLDALKSQMELEVIRHHGMHLSKDVIKATTKYASAYTGVDHLETDEELAYAITDKSFGDMLGKVYVEKTFPAQTKADVIAMVEKIRDTYSRRIAALDWLSPATKASAQKKLDTLVIKIGYPDKWKEYPGLAIKPYAEGGNLVQAVQAVEAIDVKRNIAELNQAPDRSTWSMTPQTVNAYYNPLNNEIVFPAAILQAPFYSANASFADNLGGIGAVIGHEISHAFDISGSQFDEKGNLNNWWTQQDLAKFQQKTKQAADIYSAIEVAPGHHINGEISTGEIMADLGGLSVALDIARQEGVSTRDVMKSYAKVWRNVGTEEALLAGLTDEHPPGKYRVNNIVNLMDEFYTDFDVQPSDKMYVAPKDRLKVW